MKSWLICLTALAAGCSASRPLPPSVPAGSVGPRAPATSAGPKVMSRLKVVTEPAGALVFIEGKPKGASPIDIEIPTGRYLVALQHGGHYYSPQFVDVSAERPTTYRIRLKGGAATDYKRAENRGDELRVDAAISDRQDEISRCLTAMGKGARRVRGTLIVEDGRARFEPDPPGSVTRSDQRCILRPVQSALPPDFKGNTRITMDYRIQD